MRYVMKTDYDISCIGIGMANASLVLALNDIKSQKTVSMFETEDSFDDARTWCFWGRAYLPDYLKPLISKSWSQWQVSDETDVAQHHCDNLEQQYHFIKGADFYQYFMEQCHKNKRVELHFSTPVTDVQKHGDSLLMETGTATDSISARYITDSRLDTPSQHKDTLLQCFVGVWLESSTALFDPNCVGLMERMTVTDSGAFRFVYILPVSERRALYEVTYFSQSLVSLDTIKSEVKANVAENFDLNKLHFCSWEQGVLPMSTVKPRYHDELGNFYTRNGIAGGHIRASSGYTFLPTQRWANAAALHIEAGLPFSSTVPIPSRYTLMDTLFLRVLRNNMSLAPELFKSLIQNTHPNCFTQFMSESASLFDLTHIVFAMPKRAFIRAL